MKRFLPLAVAVSASVLFLSACLGAGGGTGVDGEEAVPEILVSVTDSATGQPVGADTVYWSYHSDSSAAHKFAHGSDTTQWGAVRLDSAGTQWRIRDDGLHGMVYIRARYEDFLAASLCGQVAYKVMAVNADTLPKSVTLILDVQTSCL